MKDNSKLYLFAIGGTGARVVRSLTMLLASGIDGLNSTVQVVPIIVDFDLSNGDKTRALAALEKYNIIYNALYPDAAQNGVKYEDNYFMTRITSLKNVGVIGANPLQADYQMYFGPKGQVQKFSSDLDTQNMSVQPTEQETLDLIKCLYDDSPSNSPDAELELDLAVGFKGNPNIGSVVFHDIDKTDEFRHLVGSFTANDRIFIVSSIFGGTDSSGFPEIVNAIRRCQQNPALQSANIGAAVVLPYFGLQQPRPGTADTGAIDATSFNAKARAALSFYANHLNSKINSLYYIGDEIHDNLEYSEGSTNQQNPAHVVEFIAATSIIEFMKNDTPRPSHAYEYGIKDGKVGSFISYSDFHEGTQGLYLDRLSEFAFGMKFYRDVVLGDRSQVSASTSYYSDSCYNIGVNKNQTPYKEISDFLDASNANNMSAWGFYPWLSELGSHAHKLSLFNMTPNKDMRFTFTYKGDEGIRVTGFNPAKDDKLNSKMNDLSKRLSTYDAKSFFKNLRTMSHTLFQSVK